jgi:hypothetical protein
VQATPQWHASTSNLVKRGQAADLTLPGRVKAMVTTLGGSPASWRLLRPGHSLREIEWSVVGDNLTVLPVQAGPASSL